MPVGRTQVGAVRGGLSPMGGTPPPYLDPWAFGYISSPLCSGAGGWQSGFGGHPASSQGQPTTPCFEQEVGRGEFLGSLPTWIISWACFCRSVLQKNS